MSTPWSLFKVPKAGGRKKKNRKRRSGQKEEEEFKFNYQQRVRLVLMGTKKTGKTSLGFEYFRRTIERDADIIRGQLKDQKQQQKTQKPDPQLEQPSFPFKYTDGQLSQILKRLIADKKEIKLLPIYQRLMHEENEYQRLYNLRNCRAVDEQTHIEDHSAKLIKENELLTKTEEQHRTALETQEKKMEKYFDNLKKLEEKWISKRKEKLEIQTKLATHRKKIEALDQKFESIGNALRSTSPQNSPESEDEVEKIRDLFTKDPTENDSQNAKISSPHSPRRSFRYTPPVPSAHLVRCFNAFNKKPKEGFNELMRMGIVKKDDPISKAVFLARCASLDVQMVGEYLGTKKNAEVLEYYTMYFMQKLFTDSDFMFSLKAFLSLFQLPKEGQQVTHITDVFTTKYCQLSENPISTSIDAAYMLATSILMINSERPGMQLAMTIDDFIDTNEGIDPEYSSKAFKSIRAHPWVFKPMDFAGMMSEEEKYSRAHVTEMVHVDFQKRGDPLQMQQKQKRRRESFLMTHQRQKSKSMDVSKPDTPLFFISREFTSKSIQYFQVRDTHPIEVQEDGGLNMTDNLKKQIMLGDFFLCVYSVTDRASFDTIEQQVHTICNLKQNGTDQILLVANKADLEERRQVSTREGKDLAVSLGIPFVEVSATRPLHEQQHVSHLFQVAFECMIEPISHRIQKHQVNGQLTRSQPNDKSATTDFDRLVDSVNYFIQ